MACLAIAVVLALVALVVLMMHQWHHKRLTFRWWAVPAILLVGAASFPQSIVTTLYFVIQAKVMAPYDLALWITDAWREYGRYAAFIWVVGFPLILWRKGVVFEVRRDAVRSVAVAILIMLPLTVFDANLFSAANRNHESGRILSVSPNGRLRATVIASTGSTSYRYEMFCEDNAAHPWLARRLAVLVLTPRGADEKTGTSSALTPSEILSRIMPRPGEPPLDAQDSSEEIVWSQDSQVIALYDTGLPLPYMAYDLTTSEALTLPNKDWRNPVQDWCRDDPQPFPFVGEVKRLLAAHGGPAGHPHFLDWGKSPAVRPAP